MILYRYADRNGHTKSSVIELSIYTNKNWIGREKSQKNPFFLSLFLLLRRMHTQTLWLSKYIYNPIAHNVVKKNRFENVIRLCNRFRLWLLCTYTHKSMVPIVKMQILTLNALKSEKKCQWKEKNTFFFRVPKRT